MAATRCRHWRRARIGLAAASIELGACPRPPDLREPGIPASSMSALLDDVDAEAQRDAGSLGGAPKPTSISARPASLLAAEPLPAKEDPPVATSHALEGDVHGRRGELGLADDVGVGHAGEIDRQPAPAAGGGSNPLERQIREQQHEHGLRTLAGDACRRGRSSHRRAWQARRGRARRARYRNRRRCRQLDGGLGRLAFARRDETDMDVRAAPGRKIFDRLTFSGRPNRSAAMRKLSAVAAFSRNRRGPRRCSSRSIRPLPLSAIASPRRSRAARRRACR